MNKITLNQKRFLIVWICIHSLALFVNVFKIYGSIKALDYEESYIIQYKFFTNYSNHKDDFWPITRFITNDWAYVDNPKPYSIYGYSGTIRKERTSINGLFYNYDYSEFIFYILLGLGIIYLPKAWNTK